MEEVLKSRGLGKSLSFLNRLHNVVLRKAQITLEFNTEDFIHDCENSEDIEYGNDMEPALEKNQVLELRRYGVWSKEAKELMLPSYTSAFLFLSLIPLEVIHEFLKMRLESKVLQPSALSLEQVMKELREGLSLAVIHRERYKKHILTVLNDASQDFKKYMLILENFNITMENVFELYLTYVNQLVLNNIPETHKKTVMDEEWRFSKLISPMIPGQHKKAGKCFCNLVKALLENSGTCFVEKIKQLDSKASNVNDSKPTSIKWQLLSICRETQQIFMDEREKTLKLISFAKALCKDINKIEFHREHVKFKQKAIFCRDTSQAIDEMKEEACKFRFSLVEAIVIVQTRCSVQSLADLDEIDYSAVLSRTREILHQSFKYGFEYHKELQKLFEIGKLNQGNHDVKLSNMIINFAMLWMKFVRERCEQGRGVRPRWASHGFDFLMVACDPVNTNHLSDKEFEELKNKMDDCISHVVGAPERTKKSPRSRKNSPHPGASGSSTSLSNKGYLSQISVRSEETSSGYASSMPSSPDSVSTLAINTIFPKGNGSFLSKANRYCNAIKKLEEENDDRLRTNGMIGCVKENYVVKKVSFHARSLNFSWHRGIKIGQGRFGKVYTAVNNTTGELIAMKEIPIQPGETNAISKVAEELKIFEGISHRHLVKYYGIEIHQVCNGYLCYAVHKKGVYFTRRS